VDSDSTAYVTNGDFKNNGDYGIDDTAGPLAVYWTLTKDVYCTNNDIAIATGWISPKGGKIIGDNCTVTVEGTELNLSSGEEGFTSGTLDTNNPDSNGTFGGSDQGVELIVTTNSAYTDNVDVTFYDTPPGGVSGFSLTPLGKYITIENSSEIDINWTIIKVYYTDEEVTAAGLDESTLRLEYYNETSGTWTRYDAPDGGVDTTENYVWANVTHFSIWGIFGSSLSSGGGNGGGGGGGSGVYTVDIGTISSTPLAQTLSVSKTYVFYLAGEQHTIKLVSYNNGDATFKLDSAQFTLREGETKLIGFGDSKLEFTLVKVAGNAAVTFKAYLPPSASLPPPTVNKEAIKTEAVPPVEQPATAPAQAPAEQPVLQAATPAAPEVAPAPAPKSGNSMLFGGLVALAVAAMFAYTLMHKKKQN
jgi:hypothetical protein